VRIVNIMLGKGLGGIEQACVDYSRAMMMSGHEVILVLHPKAAIAAVAKARGVRVIEFSSMGAWDWIAPKRLSKIFQAFQADVVVTHGNRALTMAKRARLSSVPVVAVSHNYHHQHLRGADAVFAITQHMADAIAALPNVTKRIYVMPNMIEVSASSPREVRAWGERPVIGALGRFVAKKGFDVFLRALAELKARDVAFQAVLGGSGEEEAALRALAAQLQLDDCLTFSGWVSDPRAFMRAVDVFCLPSLHEPFGIVLLEAMAETLPIIATNSEGPQEIITHLVDGVMVQKGDAQALADGLALVLQDEARAKSMAVAAFAAVQERYTMTCAAQRLDKALHEIMTAHAAVQK
jgi:glycosyltransferase involved in cell wall biosynthesis